MKEAKENLLEYIIIIVLISILVFVIFAFSGCKSQGIKDALEVLSKETLETRKDVKGNHNIITENTKQIQETNTLVRKTNNQIQQGVALRAESIEKMESSVKSVQNSTFLVLGVVGLILLAFSGVIYMLIKQKAPALSDMFSKAGGAVPDWYPEGALK